MPTAETNRFVRSDRANLVRPERECWRCKERGQTWAGDAPKCGFPDRKVFVDRNWNCATLNALREYAEESKFYSEDQYLAVFPWDGQFIVLSWHKNRGCTEGAWLVSSGQIEPLHIKAAERFLNGQREAE